MKTNSNLLQIFLGILPIVAFIIIDAFGGLKSGLIAAVFVAILEVGYSLYNFGKIDALTLLTVGLVLIFSGLSYYKKSYILFKVQPTALGVILFLVCIISYFIGKPLFLIMMQKYSAALPSAMKGFPFSDIGIKMLTNTTLTCGFGFLIHGLGNLYFAFYTSTITWGVYRALGFYLILIPCLYLARFL